jgi:hypothetical protein
LSFFVLKRSSGAVGTEQVGEGRHGRWFCVELGLDWRKILFQMEQKTGNSAYVKLKSFTDPSGS